MNKPKIETATLGGGCFWCLEAIFNDVLGVEQVISGYSGGEVPNPSWEQVCSGQTGHAEVVQVRFNTNIITYPQILEIFFYVHDPTTLNRQGYDTGTEYRSVIFYHDNQQKLVAETAKAQFAPTLWSGPIVTEIAPLKVFYQAEDYHQNFFKNHPEQAYCQVVINPKLQKFRRQFESRLKT